jgi:signal transduction histidine kinase/CheY-like chemotaxis protein
MSDDSVAAQQAQQLSEITDSIIALARLDFSSPPPVRGTGALDAVAAGLMALGEELQASVLARKEAEDANEAKTRFLANMSHELRTPLTTILGNSELLQNTQLDDEQTLMIERVQQAGGMLMRLITDVLDFSKIQAGTLRIESEPFRLRDTLDSVLEQHRLPAKAKGLRLLSDLDDLDDLHVQGDRHRVEQVLCNLLSNAIKYTQSGEVVLTTQSQREGEVLHLTVSVRDTGSGISEDRLEQIFERFATGDASIRRRQSGAGLGLSISRSLVLSMGGSLTVESTLKQGSTFTINLPLRVLDAIVEPSPAQRDISQHDMHILVVDDTELVRQVTADMLKVLGCQVTVASSGQEAMAKIAFSDFDLILMDCQMPLMDGLETTRRLIELYPERNLNIVAITAHSTARDREMSLHAGMMAHLNKPYSLEQLEQLITTVESSADGTVG